MTASSIRRTNLAARLGLGALLALSVATTGCLFNVGNATLAQPTVGRQLMDLEEARKGQLLSEEEYEKLRKRIIERGPVPDQDLPKVQGGRADTPSE